MSCPTDPTRLANVPLLLIQVAKKIQQIGDHIGDKVLISSLFGLFEHLFLTYLPCRDHNRPNPTCKELNSELEEENFI
jgi:hypothetical protein